MKKRITINSISDQLLYVPNRKEGQSLFNGEVKPSEEVKELIGAEGIQYIKDKITSIIENRKEMFGNKKIEYYGLNYLQRFYDLKNKAVIKVRDCIEVEEKRIHEEFQVGIPNILATPKYEKRMSMIHDYVMHVEDDNYLSNRSNIGAYNAIKSGDHVQWIELPDF